MERGECKKIIEKITKRATRLQERQLTKRGFERCRVLPVTLKDIYVFGSYLKGKKNPGDVDLLVIYYPLNEYEEAYYWRSDARGYYSIDTALKKLIRGIKKDKIDVVMRKEGKDFSQISPEGKLIDIDQIQKVWSYHGLS